MQNCSLPNPKALFLLFMRKKYSSFFDFTRLAAMYCFDPCTDLPQSDAERLQLDAPEFPQGCQWLYCGSSAVQGRTCWYWQHLSLSKQL